MTNPNLAMARELSNSLDDRHMTIRTRIDTLAAIVAHLIDHLDPPIQPDDWHYPVRAEARAQVPAPERNTNSMTDLTPHPPSALEASAAAKVAQDEVAKAERSGRMAAEFARYALEDVRAIPDLLHDIADALTDYQAAVEARDAAMVAVIASLEKELGR